MSVDIPWSDKSLKSTPIGADQLMIIDSTDAVLATQNKRILISSLPATSGVASINADTTTAQIIAAGIGLGIVDAGNTHTLSIDGTVVTLTGTQTLTNKTLTAPIISTISNTGILTLPTSTDTLVGRNTTDTLTNKTLTTPTIVTPTIASFTNAQHNHQNATGGGTLLSTASLSDTGNITYLNTANVFGDFNQTFKDNSILIESPNGLTPITLVNSQQTLSRNVTIPLLTANDTFVMLAATQTLSNKTLTTPTIASFTNATHNHSNDAGGGNLTNSALTSGVFSSITGIGTQSQALNMNSNLINNVSEPASPQDAATKNYVDTGTAIWSKSGSNIFQTTLTDKVGIGLNNPSASLHVKVDSTSTIGSIIQAFGIQTDDLFQVRNSTGTPQIIIDKTFRLGIGVVAPLHTLEVGGTTMISGDFDVGSPSVILHANPGAMRVGINTGSPSVTLEVAGAAKITGVLDMTSQLINNVLNPVSAQDAATKNYVDTGTAIWSKLGSNIFQTTLTDKVGIGTNAPVGVLDVRGDADFTFTATLADTHSFEIMTNAASFGDVKALDINYSTGALLTGSDNAVVLVNIDESQSLSGILHGFEVLTTNVQTNTKKIGLKLGIGIDPINQSSGVFANATRVLVKAVNETSALSQGGGGNTSVFVADNDTVTIGSTAKFEEIEFIIDTISSGNGIIPTFQFSTGVGTFSVFSPTDGTNGFTNTGAVAFEDSSIPTWAVGANSEFLIKITRTADTLTTTPILDLVQISAVDVYLWDKSGNLSINDLSVIGTLELNNPAKTFQYIITPAAITADRILNLPLLTGTDTLVTEAFTQTLSNKTLTTPTIASFTNATHNHQNAAGASTLVATLALTATGTKDSTTFLRGDNTWAVVAGAGDMVLAAIQTVTGAKTFDTGTFLLNNPANTFAYTILGSAITAARNVTIPLLTTNDTFVTEAFAQTLTNKILTTPTISSFTNATHNHQNAAGGGTLLSTAALSDTTNIAYLNTSNTYTAGTRQDFLGLLAGTSGLNVGGIAGNPTTQVNGDIWLNTSSNTLFARINGANVDIGVGAGGGEANTIASLGGGTIPITATVSKSGVQLQVRSISNGSGMNASVATDLITLAVASTVAQTNQVNIYTAGTRQDFLGLLAGTSGLNVGGIAGNPTTQVDGDVWLNTSSNTLFGRINGANVDLGAGAGEVFTWSADHSMATFKLTATAANDVILNAPTSQATALQVNAVEEYSFNATQADFLANNLTNLGKLNQKIDNTTAIHELEANHTIPADGQVIGQTDYIDDSSTGVRRTYAQVRSVIQDSTNTSEDAEIIFSAMNAGTLTEYISIGNAANRNVKISQDLSLTGFDLLNVGGIQINNPADTFQYIITPAAIVADRILNLPLLTGTDTLVTEAFTQTLSNKTLTTPTIASFVNATHNHSNAAGGGLLTNSALTSGVFGSITGLGTQTQDLELGGFDINSISNLEFQITTGAPAGTVTAIYMAGDNDIVYNSTTDHKFNLNGTKHFEVSAGVIALSSNLIIRWGGMSNSSIKYLDSTGFQFRAFTNDDFDFQVNAVSEYLFNATQANFKNNNIINLGTLNAHTIPGGTDTFAMLNATQTLTNKTLDDVTNTITGVFGITGLGVQTQPLNMNGFNIDNVISLDILNVATTAVYLIRGLAITANTILNLPLITATDTLVSENVTQTLTNKTLSALGNATFNDASNMIFNTTTGTKIGTLTTQKMAFWNATPIVQPAHIADPAADVNSLKTAVDAILAQLASMGLQASS